MEETENCITDFDSATIAIGKKAAELDDNSSSASSTYSANKKKKNKVRKDNVCLVDIKYNKPAGGISSNTVFVGMEDDSENCQSVRNDFPIMNDGGGDIFRKPDAPIDITNAVNESIRSSPQTCADDSSEENLSINDGPEDQVETEVFLDEIVKLKSQLKLAQKEVKILTEEKEKLKSALNEEKSSVKNDSKKVQKDFDKMKEKFESLKKELSEKSEQCSVLTLEKSAFLDRLKTLEKENEKLQYKINQEMVNSRSEDQHRAVCAEITVLTLQRNYELEMKERALNDVKKIITHMDSIVAKLQGQECVEAHKYQQEFTVIMNKLENDMRSIKKQFDEQIELVKNGALLCNLKRIEAPRLLNPPPLIKLSSVINRQATAVSKNENAVKNLQQNSIINHFPNPAVIPAQPVPQQQSIYPNFYPAFQNPVLAPRNSPPPNLMPPTSLQATVIPLPNTFRPPQPPAGFYTEPVVLVQAKPPGLDTSLSDAMQLVRQMQSKSSSGSGVSSASIPKMNIVQSQTVSVPSEVQAPKTAVLATATPTNTNSEAAQPRANSKFNQIFEHFAILFPSATQEEVKAAIQEFRENQADKKLSGKTMSQLKAGVEEILRRKFGNMQAAHSGSQTRASSVLSNRSSSYNDASSTLASNAAVLKAKITPAPQFSSHFSATDRYSPARPQTQMPQDCCICFEALSTGERLRLDCGHEAHKSCLNNWLAINKTCPMCRRLALPEEEYPRLE